MDYSNDPSTGRWVSPTRHTLTYNAQALVTLETAASCLVQKLSIR